MSNAGKQPHVYVHAHMTWIGLDLKAVERPNSNAKPCIFVVPISLKSRQNCGCCYALLQYNPYRTTGRKWPICGLIIC